MKQYIRSAKINHPAVRLGMKKADMIKGLKKAGHWDASVKKKLSKDQQSFLSAIQEPSAKKSKKSKKKKKQSLSDYLGDITP
jgi:hypothetical protein